MIFTHKCLWNDDPYQFNLTKALYKDEKLKGELGLLGGWFCCCVLFFFVTKTKWSRIRNLLNFEIFFYIILFKSTNMLFYWKLNCIALINKSNKLFKKNKSTFRRKEDPSTFAFPISWQVRSKNSIGWTPDNFASLLCWFPDMERLLAAQTRNSSIVFCSSSMKVYTLLEVRGTIGAPTVPSNVKDANPALVIPCICPLYSLIWNKIWKKKNGCTYQNTQTFLFYHVHEEWTTDGFCSWCY